MRLDVVDWPARDPSDDEEDENNKEASACALGPTPKKFKTYPGCPPPSKDLFGSLQSQGIDELINNRNYSKKMRTENEMAAVLGPSHRLVGPTDMYLSETQKDLGDLIDKANENQEEGYNNIESPAMKAKVKW